MKKLFLIIFLIPFLNKDSNAQSSYDWNNREFKFKVYEKLIVIKESDLDTRFKEYSRSQRLLLKEPRIAHTSYSTFKDYIFNSGFKKDYMEIDNLGYGRLPQSFGYWYVSEENPHYKIVEKQSNNKDFKKLNRINGTIFSFAIKTVLSEANKY